MASSLVVRRLRRTAFFAAAVLVLVAAVALVAREDRSLPGGVPAVPTPPDARNDRETTPLPDPFAYDADRKDEFEKRAAAGSAHVLYARSPGGAGATAERVARWRPQIEAAAGEAGVPPDELEALVFLESAGREDAMAGNTEGAVGLTQILAETGQNLLEHARRRRGAAAATAGASAGRCCAAGCSRCSACAPPAARSTSASTPRRRWPAPRATSSWPRRASTATTWPSSPTTWGWATSRASCAPTATEPGDEDVSYAQVYFDSTPQRNAAAQRKLASFGDDSSNYLWKLGAAREIMRLSPRRRGRARPPGGRADRQDLGRGGPAPAGLDDALRDARDSCRRRGTTRTSWPSRTTRA